MRSPAEYYIRYRLIKEPDKPIAQLEKELVREAVFPPYKEYVQELKDEMHAPTVFSPEKLTDFVSQQFVRHHKIWTMWHPHRGTKEALEIFSHPKRRSLLQTLLAGPHPDQVIIDVFIKKVGIGLSDDGLDEFRHYFWNTDILSPAELDRYVRAFVKDPVLLRIFDAPPTAEGLLYSLQQIGVTPSFADDLNLLLVYKNFFVSDSLELMVKRGPGQGRSAALKMSYDGVTDALDRIKLIRVERGELEEEERRFIPKTIEFPATTLKELAEGRIPLPVTLLNHEEEEVIDGTGD